jgi:hypothetical protein
MMILIEQRHQTAFIKEGFRVALVHVGSTGIPPRAVPVAGRCPRTYLGLSLSHERASAGNGSFPMPPQQTAQLAPQPTVQRFENIPDFNVAEVVHPTSKDRC